MIVFVILMLVFNLVMFGPPPSDLQFVAASSLGSFAVMAGLAVWLHRKRIGSRPSRQTPDKRQIHKGQRHEHLL